MKLEHVALYVNDLERAKDFFIRYFNATPNQRYHNPQKGLSTYFLTFDDNTRLEIMQRPEVSAHEKPLYAAGYTHIAFSLGSRQAVDELTARLTQDGFTLLSPPRTTGDGYYESCILDFEGNQIEITA